jgi:hypothetical protein
MFCMIIVKKVQMLNLGASCFGSKKWKIEFAKQMCKGLIHE